MPPSHPERARAGPSRAGDSVGALVHRAPNSTAGSSTRFAPRRAGHKDGARCNTEATVLSEADIALFRAV